MISTPESRFLKTGNSMVGDEDVGGYAPLELTDEGRTALNIDLGYYLTHEAVLEYDGIYNASLYFESKMEQDEDNKGLYCSICKSESRTGEVVNLFYSDGEVQEC